MPKPNFTDQFRPIQLRDNFFINATYMPGDNKFIINRKVPNRKKFIKKLLKEGAYIPREVSDDSENPIVMNVDFTLRKDMRNESPLYPIEFKAQKKTYNGKHDVEIAINDDNSKKDNLDTTTIPDKRSYAEMLNGVESNTTQDKIQFYPPMILQNGQKVVMIEQRIIQYAKDTYKHLLIGMDPGKCVDIMIEYQSKQDICKECRVFGHSLENCPKKKFFEGDARDLNTNIGLDARKDMNGGWKQTGPKENKKGVMFKQMDADGFTKVTNRKNLYKKENQQPKPTWRHAPNHIAQTSNEDHRIKKDMVMQQEGSKAENTTSLEKKMHQGTETITQTKKEIPSAKMKNEKIKPKGKNSGKSVQVGYQVKEISNRFILLDQEGEEIQTVIDNMDKETECAPEAELHTKWHQQQANTLSKYYYDNLDADQKGEALNGAKATRKYSKVVLVEEELEEEDRLNAMNIDKEVESETDGNAQFMKSKDVEDSSESDTDNEGINDGDPHINTPNNNLLGGWRWVSNASQFSNWTRIVVDWNPMLTDLMVIHTTDQLIYCLIKPRNGQGEYFCSVIYGHVRAYRRRPLWEDLLGFSNGISTRPWVVIGDFNAALGPDDIAIGSSNWSMAMEDLHDMCTQA
ncbi:hypothetical protein E3N88_21546 [Mikania micrantha]|uniref:DUF4283 domain-containing protein n=1 Tax=Mikania micrantha TaxID=192012 RepID=A0A5N6NLZ2_9ASTR|nr:hypothetical protein E3N88_21546 [Mikania micrantha]